MDGYVLKVWKLVTRSILLVDMKSLACLTSALKTRATVWLRLCASEKPERTWFVNNANNKNFLDVGIVALNFAGVRRGSREKTFSDSYFACFW